MEAIAEVVLGPNINTHLRICIGPGSVPPKDAMTAFLSAFIYKSVFPQNPPVDLDAGLKYVQGFVDHES